MGLFALHPFGELGLTDTDALDVPSGDFRCYTRPSRQFQFEMKALMEVCWPQVEAGAFSVAA